MIDPEDDGCGDADCTEKGVGAAVVAHLDAPPVLELGEHVLDLVALLGKVRPSWYIDRIEYSEDETPMSVTRWFICLIFAMLLVTGSAAKAPAQSEALEAAHQEALSYYQQARYAEAVDAWSRARALAIQEFGPNSTITGQFTGNIGMAYLSQGNYAEAELLFRRSLEINEAALGPTHPEVATGLNNLAGRVASITGQARSTLTRENGQPTDSNLAQPSSVILLRARTPICASVF